MEARVWTIPPERMKTGKAHRVPLSDAALAVLAEAGALAARREDRIFPSRHAGKQLGQTALARVLEDLDVEATAHGMRSTFRDWAEEATAFSHEVFSHEVFSHEAAPPDGRLGPVCNRRQQGGPPEVRPGAGCEVRSELEGAGSSLLTFSVTTSTKCHITATA